MKHHTELLNFLATTHRLNSYLEIGVQNPANNFDKIICQRKWGVDPAMADNYLNIGTTNQMFFGLNSDHFFKVFNYGNLCFDLIFVDGLHEFAQVKRDFENSLNALNQDGFIVIHDCYPAIESGTRVPRETKIWWGDVYRLIFKLPGYVGIDFTTYTFDHGCCVIWKDPTKVPVPVPADEDINFDYYLDHLDDMRIADHRHT